jgi:hypothetical protein
MDNELLSIPGYIDVLHMIETTVVNTNPIFKFASTCIASLRNEQ